jgi:hypothetical protein
MFPPVAEPMSVGPATVVITWLVFVSLLDDTSDFCRLMLETVLVVALFVSLLLWFDAEFFAELEALVLEELVAAACCDALLLLLDFAEFALLESFEDEDEFADLDRFARRLAFALEEAVLAD